MHGSHDVLCCVGLVDCSVHVAHVQSIVPTTVAGWHHGMRLPFIRQQMEWKYNERRHILFKDKSFLCVYVCMCGFDVRCRVIAHSTNSSLPLALRRFFRCFFSLIVALAWWRCMAAFNKTRQWRMRVACIAHVSVSSDDAGHWLPSNTGTSINNSKIEEEKKMVAMYLGWSRQTCNFAPGAGSCSTASNRQPHAHAHACINTKILFLTVNLFQFFFASSFALSLTQSVKIWKKSKHRVRRSINGFTPFLAFDRVNWMSNECDATLPGDVETKPQ